MNHSWHLKMRLAIARAIIPASAIITDPVEKQFCQDTDVTPDQLVRDLISGAEAIRKGWKVHPAILINAVIYLRKLPVDD